MTTSWSRRGFLAVSGGAALATGIASPASGSALSTAGGTVVAGAAVAGDEFDTLRLRWRTLLLGEGFSPTAEPYRGKLRAIGETATRYRTSMSPTKGSLWSDAVYGDPDPDTDTESYGYSEQLQNSYKRLKAMAEAYCQPGTGVTGDAALNSALLTGLDHLHDEVYNATQKSYGNWYNWQIGAPQALLDICVLMYDRLTADRISASCAAVDHFVPDSLVSDYTGTSTGANRIDLCRVLALRGIVGGSAAKLALASKAISPVFPYVTSGDGLYADGSLIQHTYVPYTGSYGAVLIDGLSKLFALLGGSTWAITDPNRQIFLDAVESAYGPFLHNGLVMDDVSGRAVSRGLMLPVSDTSQQDDHWRGHAIIGSVLLLGEGASPEENARWKALAKGWFTRDRYRDVTGGDTLPVAALSRVTALLGDSAVKPAAEPLGHRVFPGMDRAVHRTKDFTASLSMASKRVTYYENGNGENLRGWHSGSGMLYWWNDDTTLDGQYSDGFWPTVDPYRLPGTTASAKPLSDGQGGTWGAPRPSTAWAGGASDGTCATLGQNLVGLGSTMVAKKSWFFAGDSVVCLGAAISADDGAGVVTVIDNRGIGAEGTAVLTVDGTAQPSTLPWSGEHAEARWAHLAGHAGYVFPGGTALSALREERTGSWHDINTGAATTAVTRRYVTLLADHGKDPSGAAYSYILMPGASATATAARGADDGWLITLANSAKQQGVRVPSLGFTGINFWAAGSLGGVTVDATVAVQIREAGDGTATVSVADPTRTTGALTLTWHRAVTSVVSKPSTVTEVSTGASLTVRFGGLGSTAGVTQTVKMRLG
ncbi:polysaccharide lyase 8 family protein [Streptomyces tsukubensis]|uniref:Lyase n=1 Tax=Streptomyces tsukubensis TaxID=83656 RepID=A0A1V4AA58_9ACTN|nr:polysaccharide lyase 8 family protein [Streptomyces tsukubensis]OON80664.1 lyase [Streptomyces tsukubensis]QFR96330.1 lyase [Streptomyces tsukubensis]